MRKLILAILLAMPALLMAQGIAVYDAQAVYQALNERADAEAQLQAASARLQAEYKQMQEEFDRKYADYQALAADPSTPETIKQRRMQEILEGDKKIQTFQRQAEADLAKMKHELTSPLRSAINAAVKEVGDEAGYAVILDKSQVAYVGVATVDVTASVKAKLGLRK